MDDPLKLTRSQWSIFRHIVRLLGSSEVYGIWGVPGSGKTQLIARFARDYLDSLKIVIVAYTNNEVKDLFWRIWHGLEYYGFSQKSIERSIRVYGSRVLEGPNAINPYCNRPIDHQVRLVITTGYSAYLVEKFRPDIMMMDERSTRMPRHTGMVLRSIPSDLLISFGDTEQHIIPGSGPSVLHRLRSVNKLVMMKETLRIPDPIYRPSSYAFYEGCMRPHPAIANSRPTPYSEPWGDWELILEPDVPLSMIHCEARPQWTGGSWVNPSQARLAHDIACELRRCYLDYDICVLSPYAPHSYNVQELLAQRIYDVATAHAFLGQEADIVIVTIPRAGRRSLISWCDRIFNVLLTRSRFKLLVICNVREVAVSSSRCYKALQMISEYGLLLDERGRERDLQQLLGYRV